MRVRLSRRLARSNRRVASADSWGFSFGPAAFTAAVSRRAGLRCALSVSFTHFGADSHCHHNRRQSKSGVVIDMRKTQ